MELLVTYDVDTTTPAGRRRLRQVAKICESYGIRVQKSVFEIVCTDADWITMRHRLLDIISTEHDSIRIYTLHRGTLDTAQHLGHSPPAPHHDPLIY
ncbi:CRISPR-associated endonuclease Cas2 [Saccharopolyspora hirsuta]|uniref:CRISPR-associated endoribonuclease Cas2 n=1 Tax=Saccharopolyspora hirsuta TaxID=1837 RepID=A0A5M7CE47_SACHI|nr:CRISPR-associated endonuclease Cas2 [Saccharopolyspora hirsuta]KAA5837944.1 CRISPR-associated endonuclease Cas2 [Saccharopolyspora hirsuta]